MNPANVSANAVARTPPTNIPPETKAILRKPNVFNVGPVINPIDMLMIDDKLMIVVMFVADICNCVNLSLKISPKLVTIDMVTICVSRKQR